MSNSHDTNDTDSNRTLTRRRALAAVAGASATGLGVAALATKPAEAEVALGGLSVGDGVHESDAPDVTPVVDVTAALNYDVPSLDTVKVKLLIGPDSPATVVASETIETTVTATSTERDLSAPVTDAEGLAAEQFAPDAEETITETIHVGLTLTITDGEETVADASVADTATIEITNTADAVTVEVGGDGTITFDER